MSPKNSNQSWHLDKRVPLALIIALLAQFAGFVAWATKQDMNDDAQNARIQTIEQRQDATTKTLSAMNDTLIRVDERQKAQTDLLQDIKKSLSGGK